MAFVATRRTLLSKTPVTPINPIISISLSPSSTIEPINSFGWTAATISGGPSTTVYTLLISASGQFSIGGNMLRLEKLSGAVGTQYNIRIQADAAGYATTTADFTLTVTNSYGINLVERINALNTNLLWQDTARTIPVTANGQSVNALNGTLAGWQASNTTGPTYVTNAQNGRAGLQFNGSTQFLSFTSAAAINFFGQSWLNNPWTIITVVKPASVSGTNVIMAWGTSSVEYLTYRLNAGTTDFLLGSGTTNYARGGGLSAAQINTASINSICSDGAIDFLHLLIEYNGKYDYDIWGNPTPTTTAAQTAGVMAPTICKLGGQASTTSNTFNGTILDILIYNRRIGTIEMEYLHRELADEWGISLGLPSPVYLDKTNWPLWFEDDFNGNSVGWTPIQGLPGSSTLGSDGNPTGWIPAYFKGAGQKTYYGSPDVSTGNAFLVDPRCPVWATYGAGNIYTVDDSVLKMQSQAVSYVMGKNIPFNIVSTSVTGNLVTTNSNFTTLGITTGMSFSPSSDFGNLKHLAQYWIANIVNSGDNSTFTVSTTPPWQATSILTQINTTATIPVITPTSITFAVTATSATGNIATSNVNFSSLGLTTGDPFTPSATIGKLASGIQYWIADVITSGANSTFTVSTIPPWQGTSILTLTNASGTVLCSVQPAGGYAFIGGAMISQGWKMREFGIVEVRAKDFRQQDGCYDAFWLMPAGDTWNAEIDVRELFSVKGTSYQPSTLHSIAYLDVSASQVPSGIKWESEFGNDGFHVYSVKWDEDGMFFYVDGRLIGNTPPWGGIRRVTVTSVGSGLTNGTQNLYAASPQGSDGNTPLIKLYISDGMVRTKIIASLFITAAGSGIVGSPKTIYGGGGTYTAQATLTMVNGSAYSVTVVDPGGGFTTQPVWYTDPGLTTPLGNGVTLKAYIFDAVITKTCCRIQSQPVWYTNSALTTPLSTGLPGVTLTVDYSDDPMLPMTYHEPFYMLSVGDINMALSGQFNSNLGFPDYQVDYIRWYKKQYPVPAKMTPGFNPTFDAQVTSAVNAIVSYWSSNGVTMSGSDTTALSLFVRTLMAYELRFDRTPPTYIDSDWNTTKLSLWDACDLLYVPGLTFNVSDQVKAKLLSKMNLKVPGTNDLTEVGSGITYAPSTGLSLPGTASVYLTSGQSPIQWTNKDNHFSLFLPAAIVNTGTDRSLAGYNTTCTLNATATSFTPYLGASGAPASSTSRSKPLTGHVVVARGYHQNLYAYKDGENIWGGFYNSNEASTVDGVYKIGSANGTTVGAQFSFLAASTGRRLMQAEIEIYNTALRTLFASLGMTITT